MVLSAVHLIFSVYLRCTNICCFFQCFSEHLQREKEVVEERRLEILKNLVNRTISEMAPVSTDENAAKVIAEGLI